MADLQEGKQKEEDKPRENEEPQEWFSSGGWLPTSKWYWIPLVVIIILAVIFKR